MAALDDPVTNDAGVDADAAIDDTATTGSTGTSSNEPREYCNFMSALRTDSLLFLSSHRISTSSKNSSISSRLQLETVRPSTSLAAKADRHWASEPFAICAATCSALMQARSTAGSAEDVAAKADPDDGAAVRAALGVCWDVTGKTSEATFPDCSGGIVTPGIGAAEELAPPKPNLGF